MSQSHSRVTGQNFLDFAKTLEIIYLEIYVFYPLLELSSLHVLQISYNFLCVILMPISCAIFPS